MTKLIGGLLIVAVIVALGYLPVYKLQQRMLFLFAISDTLHLLAGRLSSQSQSIPQLLEETKQECPTATKELLINILAQIKIQGPANIHFAWEEGTKQTALFLCKTEEMEFIKLGHILGRHPLQDQVDSVLNASRYFNQCHQAAQAKYRETQKISLSSSACFAAIFIMFLL